MDNKRRKPSGGNLSRPDVTMNHVATRVNPADVASSGLNSFLLDWNELWWHGPEWLINGQMPGPFRVDGPKRTRRCPVWELTTVSETIYFLAAVYLWTTRNVRDKTNTSENLTISHTALSNCLLLKQTNNKQQKKTRQLWNPIYLLVCVAHSVWLIAVSWISWEGTWELKSGWQRSLIKWSFREFGTAKDDFQRFGLHILTHMVRSADY